MQSRKVSYVNLAAQWREEREELFPILEQVLSGGQYINSPHVESFEVAAAKALTVEHVIGVNSGTDALVCALAGLGIGRGDEVLTPPNSFIASTAAIIHLGARPVFVDVKPDQLMDPNLIESAISKKTKAIMPVHLSGRMSGISEIWEIAASKGLFMIEDAAQAIGSQYKKIPAGKWGDVGCFSAHPLKNLNACGDAGFIATNNHKLANKIRSMRNHGLVSRDIVKEFGYVSRLDAVQAAILEYRLRKLSNVIERRTYNAKLYQSLLPCDRVLIPRESTREQISWHTFVIQVDNRDELKAYLDQHGIETGIHYPVPIHMQPAAKSLGYREGDFPEVERQAKRILTLPIHQHLSEEEICCIAEKVNKFLLGQDS